MNFPPSFYRKIFFSTVWSDGIFIARHLQEPVYRPSSPLRKKSIFFRGGGVCTQTKCAKHSHYIDYHNRYHIHSPRIQTESLSKRFFKGFSLKFCKFGGDTKVILLTSVCLFILCAAMAGKEPSRYMQQSYATFSFSWGLGVQVI